MCPFLAAGIIGAAGRPENEELAKEAKCAKNSCQMWNPTKLNCNLLLAALSTQELPDRRGTGLK